jgi:hypothetical protein
MIGEGTGAVVHIRFPDDHLSVIVLSKLLGADPTDLAVGIATTVLPALKPATKN